MKKVLISLVGLVALVGLFSLTSCNKEQLAGDGTQFRATMEPCASAKTLLDGTALNWVAGDQIAVYGTEGCGLYSATPQTPATTALFDNVSGNAGNAPYHAFYPTTLTTDGVQITLPATQNYVEGSMEGFPMYAESSDNQLSFRNLCGAIKLNLTKAGVSISTIAITAASEINGTFSLDNTGDAPALTYSANGTNTTTLTCATAQSIADGKDFYIYLPAGSYTGLVITMTDSRGYLCTKTANTAIVVERSKVTSITLGEGNLPFRPVGSKGGLFTINESGDQVWFSQGNLQYQPSTATWRFAEQQYSRIHTSGDDDVSDEYNATYTGWIDLFGWSTSGWDNGNTYYMPYNTAIINGGGSVGLGYGPTDGSSYQYDLTGTYAEADWAWHNPISNGGNAAHQWRTLSQAEWVYLFNTRTTNTNFGTTNARYAKGKVNNVQGVILFPDVYTHPTGVTAPIGINNKYGSTGWNGNNYSADDLALMEAAGAVFLPAAGGRDGTEVSLVGSYGSYWSSTHYYSANAYIVYFSSDELYADLSGYRSGGASVRPVQDN